MLEELKIRDLGVIEAAELEFGTGLTVVTGETGAGKTMVLSGLGLVTGGKAESQLVRSGAAEAVVEGRFDAGTAALVADEVTDIGGTLDDDGSLLVVRTVAARGRSRTVLGGRSVPQARLGELTADLVTVHGQLDQARLRTAAKQRAVLDAFGGEQLAMVACRYREIWSRRADVARQLEVWQAEAAERTQEADQLRTGLAEVERLAPQPGEDRDLAVEADRLRHANELGADTLRARALIAGSDELVSEDVPHVTSLLEQAVRALESASAHDSSLAASAELLRDLAFRASDAAADLSGYLDGLVVDPARLEHVEQRRADLSHLTRVYGETVDEVLSWAERGSARLLELEGDTSRLAAATAELAELDTQLQDVARELHVARVKAAGELVAAVDGELAGLAMTGAHLEVEVRETSPGRSGADEVEILLRAHPGAPARPLGAGASGGELSRVMLALEVSLAERGPSGTDALTMVFDEVDAGVGGKAATYVGERLARLADHHQVIVITHLAQVAACADTHVVVEKTQQAGRVTRSDVHLVDGSERVVELARMLSGSEDSQAARVHASELLEAAAVRR